MILSGKEATSSAATVARKARANTPLRVAARAHSGESLHSHAPRPGALRPMTNPPVAVRAKRTRSSCGRVERQPTQVRVGGRRSPLRSLGCFGGNGGFGFGAMVDIDGVDIDLGYLVDGGFGRRGLGVVANPGLGIVANPDLGAL